MVWYNSFFGHADQVANFFGIPYEEAHAEAEPADEAATENAGTLIADLKLIYNKTRQAAITTELSEIVSGAAAISG